MPPAAELTDRPGRTAIRAPRRGWWLLPSVLSGAAIWVLILHALFGSAGSG